MQYTENYQYRKPVIGIDVADVKDINFNSDKTDTLIHNTQISLAPAYDLTKTYDTGDVVMYETLMYKCKEDNVTGAWDASKWERTTAGEEGAGGGGSSVVPNPQGEPTDTLRTIGIDGTIFDIAGSGGGGGGSAYEETTLWSGSDSASMTLSESFEDYDAILFIGKATSNGINYVITNIWSVEDLKAYINEGSRLCAVANDAWYEYITISNNTTFTRQDRNTLYISEIRGLKFGGGSKAEDVLFEKPYLTGNPNTITLNHAFTDYDEIQFWTVKKDDSSYYDYLPINIVPVEYLTDAMAGTISGRTNVINISGWQPQSQYLRLRVTSTSELAVVVNNNNLLIRKIVGIKY